MASTSRTIAEVTMNYRIVQVEDGGVSRYTVESTHIEEPHILSTFDNMQDARANMVTRIQADEDEGDDVVGCCFCNRAATWEGRIDSATGMVDGDSYCDTHKHLAIFGVQRIQE